MATRTAVYASKFQALSSLIDLPPYRQENMPSDILIGTERARLLTRQAMPGRQFGQKKQHCRLVKVLRDIGIGAVLLLPYLILPTP